MDAAIEYAARSELIRQPTKSSYASLGLRLDRKVDGVLNT
jgi:hypothetical protein